MIHTGSKARSGYSSLDSEVEQLLVFDVSRPSPSLLRRLLGVTGATKEQHPGARTIASDDD